MVKRILKCKNFHSNILYVLCNKIQNQEEKIYYVETFMYKNIKINITSLEEKLFPRYNLLGGFVPR